MVWAVPLLVNQKLHGGLVAGIDERQLFRGVATAPRIDVCAAGTALRELAERHNLTNAALLKFRAGTSTLASKPAEAIHDVKAHPVYDIRTRYLLEEPAIIAAVKKGDRNQRGKSSTGCWWR